MAIDLDNGSVIEPDKIEILDDSNGPDAHIYGMQQVADELHENAQSLRNYMPQFEKIPGMTIQKSPGGHRMFSRNDIERLRTIIEYKNKNGATYDTTIKHFMNEKSPILVGDQMQIQRQMLEAVLKAQNKQNENLAANIQKSYESLLEAIRPMLNDAISNNLLPNKELQAQLEEKEKSLEELTKEVNSVNDSLKREKTEKEEALKKVGSVEKELEIERAKLKEKEEEIEQLTQQLARKKGLFGLFSK
ncbi:MerR family transcriptional regulator [Butyrivibrio sp. MC2013]|uniref:MerR family transcriptional regulator n=1 Tax=Butyrivibrio sp. MC2013 TaxID=1280686 RepID=UPI000421A01D|nr:MerR family transcriptional regulator [Butyrivibrio sp. MC2013]